MTVNDDDANDDDANDDFINSMDLLPASYAELDLADFMVIYALTKVTYLFISYHYPH